MPWQQHVADVATEHRLTDEGTREYHYKTVVVSVPRQTGKTTLIGAIGVYRAMVLGSDVFYTAQTGKDARARWMDLVKSLRKAPAFKQRLKDGRVKVALRGGSEHVEFGNGHVFQAFAPTEDSLHGYTPPTVFLDEAFAHDEMRGDMLMGAVSPAQQTIRAKQLWLVSTMGHSGSTFFHGWVQKAKQAAPNVAGFFWGAADHHNPYDVDDIAKYHPGVGMFLNDGVLTAADVLAEADRNSRAEYERAFANRRTLTLSHLIPAEVWRPLGPHGDEPPLVLPESFDEVTISYDVAYDRLASAIHATWVGEQGRPTTALVAAAPGIAWLADAVEQIDRDHQPRDVVATDHGPALEVTAELRYRGVDVDELGEREYATACGHFMTLVDTAGLRHDGSDYLATSVSGLVPRSGVVDGMSFSRKNSVGDSSAGIAAVIGLWRTQRRDTAAPNIYFGRSSA